MAHLGDSVNSERGRVALIVLQTVSAMALTAFCIELFGLVWIFEAIDRQSPLYGMALAVALWSAIMLALARSWQIGVAILRGLRLIIKSVWRAVIVIFRLAFIYAPASIPAAGRFILGQGYDALHMRAAFVLGPYIAPVKASFERVRSIAAARRESLAKEWKLRRAYHKEFRQQFGSYRAFRAHYDAMDRSNERSETNVAADPLPAACRTLGLPEDGSFTESAFKARYRELMKKLHPDIAGPNERAASVNAAGAAIRRRKGWS